MDAVAEQASFRQDVIAPPNDDIRATVEQVEAITIWAPRAILALFVGLPVLLNLLSGSIGLAIVVGVIMFFVARIITTLVDALVVRPMTTVRYKAAASALSAQVQSLPEPTTLVQSWSNGAPGALAITRNGHLVLVDRSTNYSHLWLQSDQIVNVGVEREATQITKTKHGGSFTFGSLFGSGLFGAYNTGSRSRSTTKTIETAFLEIQYQLERNGSVYISIIPFGSDRRGADALCAAITRIEHAG